MDIITIWSQSILQINEESLRRLGQDPIQGVVQGPAIPWCGAAAAKAPADGMWIPRIRVFFLDVSG